MKPDSVVVDANIAFKCLVSQRGDIRDRLESSENVKLYAPAYLFVELFKHKERLAHATRLGEEELLEAFHVLVSRLEFINEANISLGVWIKAYSLCKDTDEKDTPYVALALHLEGRLWTEDIQIKQALRAKGFNNFFPAD